MSKKLEGSHRERFGYYSLSVLERERELSISFLTSFFSHLGGVVEFILKLKVVVVVLLPSSSLELSVFI